MKKKKQTAHGLLPCQRNAFCALLRIDDLTNLDGNGIDR